MTVLNEWFFPRGTLTRDRWECVVDGNTPGWSYTGIHVAALDDDTIGLPAADTRTDRRAAVGQLRSRS